MTMRFTFRWLISHIANAVKLELHDVRAKYYLGFQLGPRNPVHKLLL